MRVKRDRTTDQKLRERLRLIGLKIWYLRKRRGLTQIELAEKAGISPSYLASIEANRSAFPCMPTLPVLYQIADAMEISISEIVDPSVGD